MADTDAGFVLDGNAAASLLHEVFVFDVTSAQIQCAACGAIELVGSLPLYAAPMGCVLRCRHCEAILLRAVRTSHGRWLEMTGTRYLRS
jgi:ribosomal protein S27E